jgi:hypothetical protein
MCVVRVSLRAILISIVVVALPALAQASVQCTLSNFIVDAYDHGGTYLHGSLNGVAVNFIDICGTTNGVEDCTSKGTDRRLAVALAAQAQGKSLTMWFLNINSCADFTAYTRAADLYLAP